MRILVVHGRYRSVAPSGENNVVDRESAALVAAGHDVELFQRDSDDIADWSLARKVTLPVGAVWNEQARREVAARLAANRPDVVHLHNTFPLLSPSVLYACRDAGVPVVATIHNYKLVCASGDLFRDGEPCHDCLGGRTLPAVTHGCYRSSRMATLPVAASLGLHRRSWRQLVSAYVFISGVQRDLLADLDLPADRVFVKHNFVPDVEALPSVREHLVAYLGRLDAAKGIPFLMRSWEQFRTDHPRSPLRLVVAGGGPLADDVARWGAGHPSVEVAGQLAPTEAIRLLRRATAVVVPSQWEETFGLVAVEAMAAGVAPIAPARGSFPELLEDGTTGALYLPGEAAALAAVLADVDRRPQEFLARGRRARIEYERRFRVGPNIEELLEIYRFACARPRFRDARVVAPSRKASS
ncbi:MAG: glycosyltransferase [Nocardioides sp.]